MASEEETQQEDTVQLREHGNMMNRPLVVGVLFESDEWSDHKLGAEISSALKTTLPNITHDVRLINMQQANSVDAALECDVLVSRVFASALNRGHEQALRNMDALIQAIEGTSILLINEPRAHAYEIDKFASTAALHEAGISTPRIYAKGTPQELAAEDETTFSYPCVIKPVCSGRTVDTAIVQNEQEARNFLSQAPEREFIVQHYIAPERGFITRVEIIGGKVALVVKRGVADNGLSAYRFGSTYQLYPDVSPEIVQDCETAAAALGFTFGSFDVIESEAGNFFIDANSVSNVSEDNTEMFGRDLMREHAEEIVRIVANRVVPSKEDPTKPVEFFLTSRRRTGGQTP